MNAHRRSLRSEVALAAAAVFRRPAPPSSPCARSRQRWPPRPSPRNTILPSSPSPSCTDESRSREQRLLPGRRRAAPKVKGDLRRPATARAPVGRVSSASPHGAAALAAGLPLHPRSAAQKRCTPRSSRNAAALGARAAAGLRLAGHGGHFRRRRNRPRTFRRSRRAVSPAFSRRAPRRRLPPPAAEGVTGDRAAIAALLSALQPFVLESRAPSRGTSSPPECRPTARRRRRRRPAAAAASTAPHCRRVGEHSLGELARRVRRRARARGHAARPPRAAYLAQAAWPRRPRRRRRRRRRRARLLRLFRGGGGFIRRREGRQLPQRRRQLFRAARPRSSQVATETVGSSSPSASGARRLFAS